MHLAHENIDFVVFAYTCFNLNLAVEQRVTVRNNAEIQCRVRSRISGHHSSSTPDGKLGE